MSRYEEIRFRGIVKKELREIFEPIALYGKWEESPDPVLRDFGESYSRASSIPCAESTGNSFVKRWNETPWEKRYNKETGEWQFQVEININYNSMLLIDFKEEIIPYLMESIDHYEAWIEPIGDDPYTQDTSLQRMVDGSLEVVGFFDEDGNYEARK